MSGEKIALVPSKGENGFYTGQETSSGEPGTGGISRRILPGLTIISVLIALGCSIYGAVQTGSVLIVLPFLVVTMWIVIHFLLLYFARREEHDFHPPAWFLFVSSGHIFIQALVVIILTLVKK